MSTASVKSNRVIDAARASIPLFATDAGQKVLKGIQERAILVGVTGDDAFWTALDKSVVEYLQNPPTEEDAVKINAHNAEIKKIQASIDKIAAGITTRVAEKIANAAKAGDTASVVQLTLEMQQDVSKRTQKQRKAIEVEQKCIVTLENKQLDAGIRKFCEIMSIHTGDGSKTGGKSLHPFVGQRFYVKATRSTPLDGNPLAYAANWYVDIDTRRIWVELTGDGYNPEWRLETLEKPLFAGFWREMQGKAKVSTKSRLNNLNYMWITVASTVKPKNQQDLFEVINRCNMRRENGNVDTDYSGGAAYALRLVEEFESDAADAGSQKLLSECPEVDWDELESHKALLNDVIDEELAENGENIAETDSPEEETAEPAKKAA